MEDREEALKSAMSDLAETRTLHYPITGECTLWINHGHEGWQPRDFKTVNEAVSAVAAGETYGSPHRITCALKFSAYLDSDQELVEILNGRKSGPGPA